MAHPNPKLLTPLSHTQFPFSKRMLNFFKDLGLITIGDLSSIPLEKLTCFRGFKTKRKQELIAYIRFEKIESLFEGFDRWKETDI